MRHFRSETIILALLTAILFLSGYMAYKWHKIELKESYQMGLDEGEAMIKEDINNQLETQGYVRMNFKKKSGTVTYTMVRSGSLDSIRQEVAENYDLGYLQGFSEGRSRLATDMLSQLKSRGYIKYNFTDGKNILPVTLTPGLMENG